MLDLRSFGYGHRYIAGVKKKNQLELCLKSFGLVSYYYGREAGLELREDVETVIEPGMVGSKFLLLVNQIFSISGGIYGADGDSASGPARCGGVS